MICAVCGEPVGLDGPFGYVHEDGSKTGDDGHTVVPIKGSPAGAQAFGLA